MTFWSGLNFALRHSLSIFKYIFSAFFSSVIFFATTHKTSLKHNNILVRAKQVYLPAKETTIPLRRQYLKKIGICGQMMSESTKLDKEQQFYSLYTHSHKNYHQMHIIIFPPQGRLRRGRPENKKKHTRNICCCYCSIVSHGKFLKRWMNTVAKM